MSDRSANVKYVHDAYRYFAPMQEKYDRYDFLHKDTEQREKSYRGKIFHVASLVFGLFCGAHVIGTFVAYLSGYETIGEPMPLLYYFEFLGMFILFAVPHLFSIYTKVYNKKKIPKNNAEMKQIAEEIAEHYQARPTRDIALEYAYPETLHTLYKYLETGRADSLKEAINLYEQSKHDQQVMEMQKRILDEVRNVRYVAYW